MWAANPGAGLADPTRPADIGVASFLRDGAVRARGPVLQSTLVSPYRKVAVIDGRPFKVGDRIGGAEIIEIRPYEIVLKREGRVSHLRMLPELAKETTTNLGANGKTE